ncbi:MAG: NAD(+)/NADH kinase [Bacteroidetes bacterium]|nr:NAD(+)/NADH kinase [Bacteroidota bacterium]
MVVGIVGNTLKPETEAGIRLLASILERRRLPFILEESLPVTFGGLKGLAEVVPAETMRTRASVVVAFGGDGTMLGAGRLLAGSGVPLIGVNLGKLGFLAEYSVDDLDQAIGEFAEGSCRIVERALLEATFPDNPDLAPLLGLNDIVIDKRDVSLMLRLETRINGDYLGTYNSDGLIIATPTGSTAYALAVGGPVVVPSAHVTVIAPIAPHMLTARPVVVPDTALIEVRPRSHRHEEDVRVLADGQNARHLPMGARVAVTRHRHVVCLVKRSATTYFDVLRAKLLWGIEPTLNAKKSGFE